MATTPETPRQFKWGTDSESARSEAVDDPRAQVGTIASIQTFGSYAANFHPHVHALITEGAFHLPRRGDPWFERVEWWDQKTLTELFRRLVLKELRRAKRLREETEAMLLSWQHSGFGVHAGEPVLPDHTERQEHLARRIGGSRSGGRMSSEQSCGRVSRGSTINPHGDHRTENTAQRAPVSKVVARFSAKAPYSIHYP